MSSGVMLKNKLRMSVVIIVDGVKNLVVPRSRAAFQYRYWISVVAMADKYCACHNPYI